jgi:hypothetical protein
MEKQRIGKPWYVPVPDAEWHALSPEQQDYTKTLYAGQKGGKPTSGGNGNGTSTTPAPAKVELRPNYDLLGIRNWTEDVTSPTTGRVFLANRVRDCLVYQLDVKKDQWWISRATKGFVKAKIDKLNDDTPEDFVYERDPLFVAKKVRVEDEEIMLWTIQRQPKNETERQRIRNKFGVNPQTIPYLAKKDCRKCGGTGAYTISSYPGDPVYEPLTESVECGCSYE